MGAAVALMLMSGPSKPSDVFTGATDRPIVTVPVQLAGVIDDRARFRQIFCALNADHGVRFSVRRPCQQSLQQLAGEGGASAPSITLRSPTSTPRLHIMIVPGMFGQCVKRWALPLQDGARYLRSQGYRVDTIDVGGLSSSQQNAAIIARAVPRLLKPGERLLIIGYSKGLTDILETLSIYPHAIPRGSNVVSLAGIVSGTPIADHSALLDQLASKPTLTSCAAGRDRRAVESVTQRQRIEWLADHPLPRDLTYFSIPAFTDKEDVSPPLEPTFRQLSRIDARNDGQVIATDAIIPGSHLLGYLNSDHWAVALPLAQNEPRLRWLFKARNDYPREILLEAIVRTVEETDQQSR